MWYLLCRPLSNCLPSPAEISKFINSLIQAHGAIHIEAHRISIAPCLKNIWI
jgi:hypothetical protein